MSPPTEHQRRDEESTPRDAHAIDELVLARSHGGEVHGHGLAPGERDALAERREDELLRARRRFFAAEDQAEWPPGLRADRARHVAAGHAHANLPTPCPFGVAAVPRRPKLHPRSSIWRPIRGGWSDPSARTPSLI